MMTFSKTWGARLALATLLAVWAVPARAQDGGNGCEAAEVGTPCELDGNRCTLDQCDGEGRCSASGAFVECSGPMGQCDGGKTCDPETGTCVDAPDQPAGTACELDRNKCTPDACNETGFCVPAGEPLSCPGPMGQCDGGKTCDPETGTCVNAPDQPAGTTCELDRNKCTPDACNATGFCVPAGEPVTCPGPGGQCDGGKTCDPETGSCVNLPDVPAGTACEVDRNKCTPDQCNGKGYCVHNGPPITCDDGDVCTDDACERATGACSNVEDPTNDPICSPDPDLDVDKKARCECKSDDGPGKGKKRSNLGDGHGGDVVFCDGKDECKISYEITLTNKALVGATGVQVADALPPAVTFLTSTASQGEYSSATTIWDVGDVAGGASATLTIEVEVAGSPAGALVDAGASRGHEDRGDDHKSHDDKSNDHKSDDHKSHDDKSDDHKSDDDSHDGGKGRIRNCADVVALDQPDPNPENDSDCVIVVLDDGKDCHVPRWVGRCLEQTSRLLTQAAQSDSPQRADRLLRKAERSIMRANRGMVRLNQAGKLNTECLERLDARVNGLTSEARHLAR